MLLVKNLHKSFTLHMLGGKRIEAFSDVSFQVAPGKAVVLSAPSGGGKSSVLKCIYRTYLPDAGVIRFQSPSLGLVDLASLDEHRVLVLRRGEIGYVTQFLKVLPRVSTVDVVSEPLINAGVDAELARRRAVETLRRLRIPEALFSAYPATFSGGEQQRVNIARALIRRSRLLLLDEPTASLDAESVGIVLDMLQDCKEKGTAMVAVFHDRSVAERIADSFYTLRPDDGFVRAAAP
ncbi:MAG: phosphonate C-P lyase system protein PhnL [Desulfobacteraceae bacterium]|jgi:alpha-D-ribose 1-methylphosphonate 5-triphosphate synthase subunit PhnL|nr:phosphonate C-P lyase system protein PhnL [Desulfobacteraceae bacterium]